MKRRRATVLLSALALVGAGLAVAVPSLTANPAVAAEACGSGSFQAEVVKSGSTWTARNGSRTVYTGSDMLSAVQGGINSLTANRTAKERVVVRGDGSMPANQRIRMASYTTLDFCGTITTTGSGATDMAPIYGRGITDVEVQHLNVKGAPWYGIFMRQVNNLTLGQITMDLPGGGIGVRVDNNNATAFSRNFTLDTLSVQNAGSHALETYGIDGVKVGTVTARNVGESGVLLNRTINATIGTVDAENAGAGTGYAAFRMANRNGLVGSSYPTNIKVGTVKARGGGRGIFCVSESGGATIDKVDISGTGNNAVLIENCHNVDIAPGGGTIAGPGNVRLAARSEFANNTGITLRNFTLSNSSLVENPCVSGGLSYSGVKVSNSSVSRC
ncbi:hypothetical protein [Kineosporia babensis]|uniref:Parallel beta helix pectate lyase-like protein n=1 Tax=Kineosporia babensis TaxID=499548 RepID=A0A9X1NE70_9ACTN|nr:hypothetical protein [Kineosporia babensis]MCD5313342.1 hypothetical protein [Kineosporia babensis]